MHIRSRPYARDDEGKRIVLMESDDFAALPTVGDERIAALSRRLDHSVTSRGPGLAAGLWGGSIPILCVVIRAMLPAGSPPWMAWVCVAGIGLIAYPLLVRRLMAREADRIIKVLLEDGICPCCAYNFAGLDRSASMLTCPECGAAWRTERIARAEEFAPGSRPASRWRRPKGAPRVASPVLLGQVKDDRGRRVAMADRALRCAVVSEGDADHARRVALARPELAEIGRVPRLLVAGMFVALGVILLMTLVPAGLSAGGPVLGAVFGALMMVFMGSVAYRGALAYPPAKANAVLLKHGLCPSCAADLEGLAPGADGCVECVECGAAWRMPAAQQAAISPPVIAQ